MSKKKLYSDINSSMLKGLPNPEKVKPYEVKIKQPEVTFLGVYNQPDFATLYILMYPNGKVVELKSLKLYLQQYRDVVISYERLLNQVYEHNLISTEKDSRCTLIFDYMIFYPPNISFLTSTMYLLSILYIFLHHQVLPNRYQL